MLVDDIITRSDSELVRLTIGGCGSSYAVLFSRYSEGLMQMLLSRCSNRDLCDDILQEAFIRAFLKLPRYSSSFSFGGWLTVIAQRLLIDHRRRVENRPKDSFDTIDPVWDGSDPEERFMQAELWEGMLAILDGMSDDYRRMIEMRYMRDMSYQAISEELGIPLGTVKTQIFRARREFMDSSCLD